jgi:Fur family ferric uptake transcriptional regulator
MDEAVRDDWRALATERVAGAGLRLGAARVEVIELLAREGQCLLAAGEIVARLRDQGGRAGQASVYRILDELTALGLVRRLVDEHGVARFEIAEPGSHHHHFIDDATGEVAPFSDPELERAVDAAAARAGIALSSHEIVLRGRRTGTPARGGRGR